MKDFIRQLLPYCGLAFVGGFAIGAGLCIGCWFVHRLLVEFRGVNAMASRLITCQDCGKQVVRGNSAVRCAECSYKRHLQTSREAHFRYKHKDFYREWYAWKRDFAEGKTQSNLGVPK